MKRRTMVWALGLAIAASAAQAQLPQMRNVGVFALLGDSVQVAWSTDAPRDTRIERTARESLEFKGLDLDLIALRTARDAIQRAQPAAKVMAFRSPEALSVAQQREIADGALKAELPGWMVKTLSDSRLSHLLLITRSRGTIDARTGDGVGIGRGNVDGIGFYIDTLYTIRNSNTGALSTGLLAPYLQLRLTLMDAQSGDIVATYDVRDGYAYGNEETQAAADPWNFMPAAEKVVRLRKLLEQGMARGMAQVLGTR
jgi:hypothetical protein